MNPKPTRILALLTASLFALLALTESASAQSVTAQVASQQGFVGEPIRIVVRVVNIASFEGPSFEQVAGLEINRLAGEQTSTNMTFINGRSTQQRTVALSFEAIPSRTGNLMIPAFTVESEGLRYSSQPIPISVVPSNAATMMSAVVVGAPRELYIGQQGALNLEIRIKRYTDASLGITLDEQSTWQLLDGQSSSWGVFGPAIQRLAAENRRPRGELRIIDGEEFLVYTISKAFDPISTGVPPVGDVRIRMEYPTRLQRDRSLLLSSGITLAGARSISAVVTEVDARVLPLPEGGRPNSWNGAVGEFTMMVVAKPLEVAVGEPITLTMRLMDTSTNAGLDGLQAPRIALQPEFANGFRVPDEAAAGTVEGRSKVFTQTIRAVSDTVREIPPIEFAFFNPAKGEYETLRSKPIAISVKPSAIARVSDAGNAEQPLGTKPEFTKVAGGLVANMSVEESRRTTTVSPGSFAFAIFVPALGGAIPFVIALALRRVDPRSTRRTLAMSRFERALGASMDPASIEAAALEFIAARVGAAGAGFSRKDAGEALARTGVDAATIERVDQFLRDCERARYIGGAIAREQAIEVARAVEEQTRGVKFVSERSAA